MERLGLRVGIFSLAYVPFTGGAELAVKEVTDRLPHAFTCFTHRFDSRWPSREQIGNVAVCRLGRGDATGNYYGGALAKLFYIWNAWRAAERSHREHPFQLTWAIMASYGGAAALLFKLRHPKVPLLLTLQEGDSEKHILRRVKLLYPIWKLLFRKADRIQAISVYLADFARRHGATCPVDVVPNGVDFDRFAKFRRSKRRSAVEKRRIIITTSRLVQKNGIDTLIKAVALLKRSCSVPFRVRIVGDGPERLRLEQLAIANDITDIIEFIGQVPFEEVPKYLAGADVFVRPSRSEGLGSSFIEAMASGIPVIGTTVGGIPEVVQDGETGFLVSPGDPDSLAGKLRLILVNPALRVKFTRRGRMHARSFDWQEIGLCIDGTFKKLVQPKLLVLTGIYPPEIGGSATYAATLHRSLPDEGITVETLTYGNRKRCDGIWYVSRDAPKGIRHIAYLVRAVRLARRCDLVLAADNSFGAATVGALAARIARKKFIVRVTGDYAWEQGQQRYGITDSIDDFQKKHYGATVWMLRRSQKWMVRNADLVIAPSEYLRGIALGGGARPELAIVIPNAVHMPERFSYRGARKELGLTGTVIVSAGRLVPWKGFGALIETMPHILSKVPDAKLVIIGSGPDRNVLERCADAEEVRGRVKLIGSVARRELCRYLAAADVFVLNTAYEGLSHQIIEALDVEDLPVITTYRTGNRELIDRKTFKISAIEYNDIGSIASALVRAARARQKKRRFARKRLSNITDEFSEERMVAKVAAMCGELLISARP